jgi:hypothetical protein
MTRLAFAALLAWAALLVAPDAGGKDFQPGDLRICSGKRCVAITARRAVAKIGPFYYSGGSPPAVAAPRMGAPAFELRFRNGYATGIVAGKRLDRFLSYGVHIERFRRGTWYRVPATLAAELRRLAAPLEPLRVTPAALRKSR